MSSESTSITMQLGQISKREPKSTDDGKKKKKKKKKQKQMSASSKDQKMERLKDKMEKKKQKKRKKASKKARSSKELEILEQAMMKGINLENMDLRKFDKKVDKALPDELLDEEKTEEDDGTPAQFFSESKHQPITDKKLLQQYQVDRADYMLQYANADEKPLYFDEYMPNQYACFEGVKWEKWSGNPDTLGKQLLKYTSEIWKSHTAPSLEHLPKIFFHTQSLRATSEYTNFCFNPLQAMRAWGLLLTIAQNKTALELRAFIETYTLGAPLKKKKKTDVLPDIHQTLVTIHREAESLFDGCVRLFTELPHHLKPVSIARRQNINQVYGGKSKRAGIQHHCFATDPDGFYSCYRINEEVALSTHGAVRYVVPENCAPNWRASIALVSATDCAFYWKTTESKVLHNHLFDGGPKRKSKCTVISAQANIYTQIGFKKHEMYRLESHVPDVHLYIFLEPADQYDKPKSFPPDFHMLINGPKEKWILKSDQTVHLPKCTTSMPMSLFDHAKHNGLSRIFCSEKSELKQIKIPKWRFAGSPQYTTLFDHYHKTVFEIRTHRPDNSRITREFDELAPERAHQCIEESAAKLFGKFQRKKKNRAEFFTYHEDHLHIGHNAMEFVEDSFEFAKPAATDLDLAKPFYYVLTRKFEDKEIIVCAGYFNNTVWSIQKREFMGKEQVRTVN